MEEGFAIVVDVGKTLCKVSLWSRSGRNLARRSRPNALVEVDLIRRLDADGIAGFIEQSLAEMAGPDIEYIVPVAHGAAVAALAGDALAYLPLDYEQDLPPNIGQAYRMERGAFAETGSPALPCGLNMGAQLFWMDAIRGPAKFSTTLLPWAQYWAWFLSGHATSEVTSLGCHSDLWNPGAASFSSLALKHGWADRFAPLASARDIIGTIRPELAARTGLPPQVKVLAGLHDSNAALLAARGFASVADNEATVLSTGTWFVAMRMAGESADFEALPAARDCLVNVDTYGAPVLSARFMGGREIETLIEVDTRQVDIKPDQPNLLSAVEQVVASGAMVLPTMAPGSGPFSQSRGGWINRPADWHARRAAACLYAALVADASLDLIGSKDRLLVEGRFAEAEVFVRALAALRPETQVFRANAHNDVSFGALRLIVPALSPEGELEPVVPLPTDLAAYRSAWHEAINQSTAKLEDANP